MLPNENFLQAAFRHAKDANILYDQQCYDNAMYHYGFAAECTIKAIAQRFYHSDADDLRKQYSHRMNALLLDEQFFDMLDQSIVFLNPALLLGIDVIHVPTILVDGHPERRYFPDDSYTQMDCQQVQPCVRDMMSFLTGELLDAGEWEGIF